MPDEGCERLTVLRVLAPEAQPWIKNLDPVKRSFCLVKAGADAAHAVTSQRRLFGVRQHRRLSVSSGTVAAGVDHDVRVCEKSSVDRHAIPSRQPWGTFGRLEVERCGLLGRSAVPD